MDATIDSYAQIRLLLNKEDIKSLDKKREAHGEIWITSREEPQRKVPLRVYLEKRGWKVIGKPEKPYTRKKAYEIGIPPNGLESLKNGEIIGADIALIPHARKIEVSREDVY